MQAWSDFLVKQELEFGPETISRWLRTLKVANFDACNIYLEAKDSFQVLWFDEHIRPKLAQFVNSNQKPIKVHIEVPGTSKTKRPKVLKKQEQEIAFQMFFEELDSTFSFESFLVTEENKVPYCLLDELCAKHVTHKLQAMSTFTQATASVQRDFLNPVYLYGPSGSGKTHLLQAFAMRLRRVGYKALYATADTFTDHVVKAIRSGEMSHFRKTYRSCDILLIDDVQVFGRKNATQEEFFHTFNTLHTEGKLILLSANVAPQALSFIEPRLISRFEWGISLGLTAPSRKEIATILEQKAAAHHFAVSERTIDFLAESFATNPKSATKALETLMLRSHLSNKNGLKGPMPLALVKSILSDLIATEKEKALSCERIIQSVAEHYAIPLEDLLGKSQSRECVVPRQIAMYLCRELLKVPYMKIGDLFQRDHSTVMSAIRQVGKQMATPGNELAAVASVISQRLQT